MSIETEKELNKLKAQKIAHEKSREIMESMDVCDKDNKNYAQYLYNLEYELYTAIKKALKL
jgi:hypothetical protein